jgi:hypothetical protein
MELQDFVLGLFSGLASGILVGYIVEHFRLRNAQRLEKLKRLTPHIEVVHPIVEELSDDVAYFQKTQLRNDSLGEHAFTSHILNSFDKYGTWYENFLSNGYRTELESVNKWLSLSLYGLFVHSRMVKKYGEDHVFREIFSIKKSLDESRVFIEKFLKY